MKLGSPPLPLLLLERKEARARAEKEERASTNRVGVDEAARSTSMKGESGRAFLTSLPLTHKKAIAPMLMRWVPDQRTALLMRP